jgi:hypothetical protein
MPPIEAAARRALADGRPDEAVAILRAAPGPPIRTPSGIAPDGDPPPPADPALLEAELGRAIAQIDALRRRVAALERRRAPRRRGAP